MALYATNRFAGDGVTTSYEFNFVGKYIARNHVKVYQEDNKTLARTPIAITDSNFLNDTTLRNLPVTPVGKTLVIYRDTTKAPMVDFVNGSRLTEINLDAAARQGAFLAVEAADALSPDGLAGVINKLEGFSSSAVWARDQAALSAGQASAYAAAAAGSANAAALAANDAIDSKLLAGDSAANASLSAAKAAQAALIVSASVAEANTAAERAALAFAHANALLGMGIGTGYVSPEGDLIITYVPPVTSVYIDEGGNLTMEY